MRTFILFCLALVPAVLTNTVHRRQAADDIDFSSKDFWSKDFWSKTFGGPSSRQDVATGRAVTLGRDDVPVLGGPSSRQDVDLSSLFTSGGEPGARSHIAGASDMQDSSRFIGGIGASDMQDSSRFIDTMKIAAREFGEKRALKQGTPGRRGAGDASNVVTCVYCDSRCEAQAEASGYPSAQEYFTEAIAEMNRIVQGGLDPSMSFELTFVLLPYSITEMSWFFDYSATSSEDLLTAINNKFWQDSGLYAMAQGNGCAIDYLAAAPSDPAWGYMGSVEGIANMFQLCQAAFSTVRMSPNPISLAKLMTHEFGHMIGMYHDGAMNEAFTGMASYFEAGQMMSDCAPQFASLGGACQAGNVGCASGACIMSPTVDGTDYSDCSKAYYDMFYCLIDVMPTFYNDACIAVRSLGSGSLGR